MIAIQFQKAHLDLVEELTKDVHEATKEDLLQLHSELCDRSIMVTIVDEGRIVCISGIKYLVGGTGEAFNIPMKYIRARHIRFIKEQFDYQMSFYDRIQTHSRPNNHDKWHKMMGFEKEAVLKKYLGAEDKVIWARF